MYVNTRSPCRDEPQCCWLPLWTIYIHTHGPERWMEPWGWVTSAAASRLSPSLDTPHSIFSALCLQGSMAVKSSAFLAQSCAVMSAEVLCGQISYVPSAGPDIITLRSWMARFDAMLPEFKSGFLKVLFWNCPYTDTKANNKLTLLTHNPQQPVLYWLVY